MLGHTGEMAVQTHQRTYRLLVYIFSSVRAVPHTPLHAASSLLILVQSERNQLQRISACFLLPVFNLVPVLPSLTSRGQSHPETRVLVEQRGSPPRNKKSDRHGSAGGSNPPRTCAWVDPSFLGSVRFCGCLSFGFVLRGC
jgi:hypothetical protein